METIDYHGHTLRRWTRGPSTFLARPEAGARLVHWGLRMPDGSFRDVLHWPDNVDFSNFAKIRGGNPVLFPFCDRLTHNGRAGYWKTPSGEVRPMPQHGFARDGAFALDEADANGFRARFLPGDAAREAYPFHYTFTVAYTFAELSLRVELRLTNEDTVPLPWSAGHHFYFALPWHRHLLRKHYRYQIPAKKCFRHGPDGSLQPVKPVSAEAPFPENAGQALIFSRLKDGLARFGPNGGEEDIGVRILDEGGTYSTWNAFTLWTEAPDSPFYCVEPWMGPPNAPEHHKGLHTVPPGETAAFAVDVALL